MDFDFDNVVRFQYGVVDPVEQVDLEVLAVLEVLEAVEEVNNNRTIEIINKIQI